MFKQYRPLEKDELIIVGGDCSQGGSDYNCAQFLSATKHDVPLVYHAQGVAATMTSAIYPVLEKVGDFTGIKPVVGFERNMGGASEMERLSILNRSGKYKLFVMPKIGSEEHSGENSDNLGFATTSLSRPILIGGLKEIIDIHGIGIYDSETVDELSVFIENNQGKPEAAQGGHDDMVIALGITWFMSKYAKSESIGGWKQPTQTGGVDGYFPDLGI